MKTLAEPIVVDANPLISALLGGAAREIVFSGIVMLYSTQYTLFEVEKFLPRLARRLSLSEVDLLEKYQLLPVIACQPAQYETCLEAANRLIGGRDARDAPVLALALAMKCPIWTEDRDFEDLSDVTVLRTSELLMRVRMA